MQKCLPKIQVSCSTWMPKKRTCQRCGSWCCPEYKVSFLCWSARRIGLSLNWTTWSISFNPTTFVLIGEFIQLFKCWNFILWQAFLEGFMWFFNLITNTFKTFEIRAHYSYKITRVWCIRRRRKLCSLLPYLETIHSGRGLRLYESWCFVLV